MALHNPALGLLTALDLVGVGKVEGLLALVQVDEVRHIEGAQLVHNVPAVVLRHGQLVQSHVL